MLTQFFAAFTNISINKYTHMLLRTSSNLYVCVSECISMCLWKRKHDYKFN